MPAELRFPAMGTDVHVIINGPPRLLGLARRRVHDLDGKWSRFRPDSEISRLNHAGGALVVLSPETYQLVERAFRAWVDTGGRFDPTVLGDVIRAGYDDSFDALPLDRAGAPQSELRQGAEGLLLAPGVNAVALAAGTGFDPGGIGKGLAADLVAAELWDAGANGVCVNVGGDVRVAGVMENGAPWTVSIDDPGGGSGLDVLSLLDGAVATSSRLRRAWFVDGQPAHHLIDPRTRRPVDSGVAAISVVAGECWRAEVFAKAAFMSGPSGCFDLIDAAGAAALAVLDTGEVRRSRHWADFTSAVPA